MWVLSRHHCVVVYESMCQLTHDITKRSEQHIELGNSRKSRDLADCLKFYDWIKYRNPFTFQDEHLHLLSSGLVSKSDDMVNCDQAVELEHQIHRQLDTISYKDATIKRKDQMVSLDRLMHM